MYSNCHAEQPIGIIDSGIGGLTVAKAVVDLMPEEDLLYFGDTAHFPYGDKSTISLQTYTLKIVDFLLKHHCKAILIACNSASTAAYELLKTQLDDQLLLFDVIQPVIDSLRQMPLGNSIGLIGTKHTVNSGVYQKKINALPGNKICHAQATPLLAAAIEEGLFNHPSIIRELVHHYLSQPSLVSIDALILGCTHYPKIKSAIADFYQTPIPLLDSSQLVAETIQHHLARTHLLNKTSSGQHRFYVSDYTDAFEKESALFFGKSVELRAHPLWN